MGLTGNRRMVECADHMVHRGDRGRGRFHIEQIVLLSQRTKGLLPVTICVDVPHDFLDEGRNIDRDFVRGFVRRLRGSPNRID